MRPCKKTIVLGAVAFPSRYSFKAVHALVDKGHEVIPLGIRDGAIADISIVKERPKLKGVDTVTIYLNQNNQIGWYQYLLALKPKRVIFNPGAENRELVGILKEKNIQTIEDCTLVMLAVGRY
ncbi:MAG: CoA-binding protein [Flavobacteriales bacterium]|nr:CoA-binding protein [Flavobacteriales bacterium]